MQRMILISVVLTALGTGCSPFRQSQPGDLHEYLRSEQNVLKRRVASLERANAVLERENGLLKKEVESCRSRGETVLAEKKEWKEKYLTDTGQMEGRMQELLAGKEELKATCMEQTAELASVLDILRIQLKDEVAALRQQVTRQNDAFARERTQWKMDFDAREGALLQRVEALQGEVASRDQTIETLKREIKHLGAMWEDASRRLLEDNASPGLPSLKR